jgi:hypothetical protein
LKSSYPLPLFWRSGQKGDLVFDPPPAEPVNKIGSDFFKYTPPIYDFSVFEHSNLYKDSPESKRQSLYSLVIDITNWYMRIFYYQKITGLNENAKINLKRAIESHKKISKKY